MTRLQRMRQLGGLTLGHFVVDMFGGFFIPLLPALIVHLGTTEAALGMMAGVVGITVNTVQPLAGALLHRRRMQAVLWTGSFLALGYALLGQVRTVPQLLALAVASSLGVGMFHPGALLGAHAASGHSERVGVPVFLSGGAFGVAVGAVLATQWVSRLGFERLWWLAPVGLVLMLVVLALNGTVRSEHHFDQPQVVEAHNSLPFVAIFLLASVLATGTTLLVTYLPFHLKSVFGDDAIRVGGLSLGLISCVGAFSSYGWGAISHRVSPLRLLAAGQCVFIPLLLALLAARQTAAVLALSVCCGIVAGGAFFPLVATLARRAAGFTPGMRAGLIIGGAWGIGALGAVIGAWLLAHGITATWVIHLVIPLSALAALAALVLDRWRK